MYTDAEWIGKPVDLMPWQREYIYELFELYPAGVDLRGWLRGELLHLLDPDQRAAQDWIRRFRWSLLGVPKKNGKTQMLGWLALYFVLADDEPAAKVVCAAAGEQQADLVYSAAALCVELSRGNEDDEGADLGGSRAYRAGDTCLADRCVVKEDRITVPASPGAMIVRVPASKNTSEGKNIHVLICDELHEWTEEKHEKVYTVLTNGFGARRQPLVIQITTAGDDLETIAGTQYTRGKMLQAGELDDPRYHFRWFEPPEDCDWTDLANTRLANPSYEVTVREDFFADMLTKKAEHVYRRYFLNQWVTGEKRWMRPGLFEACARDVVLEDGDEIVLGFDGSFTNDSTFVVCERLHDHAQFVLGGWERPYDDWGRPDLSWRVPWGEVEDVLIEAFTRYRCKAFGADPYRWERLLQRLDGARTGELEGMLGRMDLPPDASIPLIIRWPTTSAPRMVAAGKKYLDDVEEQAIAHNGDPRLLRHVANCTTKEDRFGPRIVKESSTSRRKIDAAVASLIAHDLATTPLDDEPEPDVFLLSG